MKKTSLTIICCILFSIASHAQKISGNWKFLQAVPLIEMDNYKKSVEDAVKADLVSVFDPHTLKFTSKGILISNGESKMKFRTVKDSLIITENNNDEESEGITMSFSIKGDTLILESVLKDCSEKYGPDRLYALGVDNTAVIEKINLKSYYIKVPDNYILPKTSATDEQNHSAQRDAETKKNVSGTWKACKMQPIAKTNNIFVNFSVKALIEYIFDDAFYGGWYVRFAGNRFSNQKGSCEYYIKNDTLDAAGYRSRIYASKDTLTMDLDIKEMEGLENQGDIVLYQAIARVYYVRIPEETYEDRYPYYEADESPKFKGGEKALEEYFQKNMKYPSKALADKIERDVDVSFVVRRDGSISDFSTFGEQRLFYDEAKRLMESMPAWEPGKINGKPVPVEVALTIKFRLPK